MTEKFNAEFIPGGAAQNSIRVTQVVKERLWFLTWSKVKSPISLHFG